MSDLAGLEEMDRSEKLNEGSGEDGWTGSLAELAASLPPPWSEANVRGRIQAAQRRLGRKIIVLDDDPTGTQTVQDVDILTGWEVPLLREALRGPEPLFYVLTNSRGASRDEAVRMNREIVRRVREALRDAGGTAAGAGSVESAGMARMPEPVFISRSDSTLRGHYPAEIDALAEALAAEGDAGEGQRPGQGPDGHLLVPAFLEGGRVTYGLVHAIVDNGRLLPVARTEFARDARFGYAHSELTRWVEEKTAGRWTAADCLTIPLQLIRRGPDAVAAVLLQARGGAPIVADCLDYADLDVLSLALLQAEAAGKRFLYRTAASFVKSFGGIGDQAPLPASRLRMPGPGGSGGPGSGGLVIVGSHVRKSTRQLEALLAETDAAPLEVEVQGILDDARRAEMLDGLAEKMNGLLAGGRHVAVFSSREVVAAGSERENVRISRAVSEALVQLTRRLAACPAFLVAKGGITSSDIATQGLGIRKARVLGQAGAGIPVWQAGPETRFPGLPYIVFPGNVGTDGALAELVRRLAHG